MEKKNSIQGVTDEEIRFEEFKAEYSSMFILNGHVTDEQEKQLADKFGIKLFKYKEPEREGHFFIATVKGKNKMLFKEPDGKVYDFIGYPDRQNINKEPFAEEWTYLRAVSGFDF